MQTPTTFINHIAPTAIAACDGKRLFPSLMIAQACLESNYGQSKLSSLHNNFFGIKASAGWKGAVATFNTTEYVKQRKIVIQQSFRSYPSLEAGFADRTRFLQVNPRYASNGVFKAKSPEEQALCFLKAGYATDPSYPQKLVRIINQYNLKKYDSLCKTSNPSITTSTTNPM
ncbi:glucosaminidase domain-containing protein [Mucilaginibacter sp. Bleaf8]|uniref:glycoside hydrolase family 73 protein n=1 Tax=Mucilaginibacter sp. Bleaf8 TaxID=2834430 RepID=UPI001BCBA59F|nr:glucosaminidase domain-containing protein [Mucilaginibacter sp. Bleaf8]MBS7564661.1 glucosaminidase domain-containing protein [Mucilaginibacter sp. Bleaf8]